MLQALNAQELSFASQLYRERVHIGIEEVGKLQSTP